MKSNNTEKKNGFHKIRCLEVTGGFLDGMRLDFEGNLNCLIGGRGTGKTTVLEMIRWVSDHMPAQSEDGARSREIDRLVQRNLGAGQITLGIETLKGVHYRVRRNYGEKPQVLGDTGEPVAIDIGRGSIFSAEIYSQNQIEDIANDPVFQLKLIDKFVTEEMKEVGSQIQICQRELDGNATDLLKLRKEVLALEDQITELPEINEKLNALKIEETGEGAKVLQKETEHRAIRDLERSSVEGLRSVLSNLAGSLDGIASELPDQIADRFTAPILNGPNGQILSETKTSLESDTEAILQLLSEAAQIARNAGNRLQEKASELDALHLKQEKSYRDLLEQFQEEKNKAKERDQLLRCQAQLLENQKRLERRKEELQKKENARRALLHRFSDLKDERYRLRAKVADTLTAQLCPTIRVRVEQYGNSDAYRNLVLENMKGAGIRYTQIVDKLVQRITPQDFAAIVQRGDTEALKEKLEIDAERASRIIYQFNDTKAIFDVEVVELHDRPTIELKDGQDYKDSSALSTGQKCTTILPILLLESASPLLIDQPEDNLDNAFIYETVVKGVREVRGKRQLIFVTHNPNIPVLGDAQRVFVLQSTGRQASVKCAGTVEQVKEEIETILEGGKEAFEERKKRYGY